MNDKKLISSVVLFCYILGLFVPGPLWAGTDRKHLLRAPAADGEMLDLSFITEPTLLAIVSVLLKTNRIPLGFNITSESDELIRELRERGYIVISKKENFYELNEDKKIDLPVLVEIINGLKKNSSREMETITRPVYGRQRNFDRQTSEAIEIFEGLRKKEFKTTQLKVLKLLSFLLKEDFVLKNQDIYQYRFTAQELFKRNENKFKKNRRMEEIPVSKIYNTLRELVSLSIIYGSRDYSFRFNPKIINTPLKIDCLISIVEEKYNDNELLNDQMPIDFIKFESFGRSKYWTDLLEIFQKDDYALLSRYDGFQTRDIFKQLKIDPKHHAEVRILLNRIVAETGVLVSRTRGKKNIYWLNPNMEAAQFIQLKGVIDNEMKKKSRKKTKVSFVAVAAVLVVGLIFNVGFASNSESKVKFEKELNPRFSPYSKSASYAL